MSGLFYAILAYSLLAFASSASPEHACPSDNQSSSPHTADLDLPVTFTLTDGTRFSGTLTRWSESCLTGSFGQRSWNELNYRDSWRLLRRLIDRDIPDDWLLLARIMLQLSLDQPEAERWAGRAFRHARRVAGRNESDAIETRIEAIRAEHDATQRDRTRRKRDPDALRMQTPEADDWPSTPWPKLSRNEQRNAVLTMKDDAEQALARIDLELDPIETATALLYTDLERRQAVRIATQLDQISRELATLLHTNPNRNPFWGKLVLIVLTSREAFDTLQTDAFGFRPVFATEQRDIFGTVPGIVHPIGPKVFITLHHPGRSKGHDFRFELTRLVVRGLLHRHISPRRLPPWAGDGLGMTVADRLLREMSPIVDRRRTELIFLRSMDDDTLLRELIDMAYGDDCWPVWEPRLAALGGLFVELMIREKPRDFVKWVEAVKRGAGWREALAEVYEVELDVLIDTAVRYYRVND